MSPSRPAVVWLGETLKSSTEVPELTKIYHGSTPKLQRRRHAGGGGGGAFPPVESGNMTARES